MRATATIRRGERGFSLVELLVTIVLASIIFLALVPLFVSGLRTTSTNSRRVVATNIAQAQLEKVRLLGASPSSYANITNANLNSATWNPNLITTTYTPPAGGAPYSINTSVSNDAADAPYKTVTVTVTRSTDNFQTKVSSVIQNPAAVVTSSTNGPTGGNGPFNLTVQFKNYTEVTSSSGGVTVVYVNTTPTPNVTTTVTPKGLYPTAGATTVGWTNLPGGMGLLYTVTCKSTKFSSTSSPFHLLSNGGFIKFDTNPGGS